MSLAKSLVHLCLAVAVLGASSMAKAQENPKPTAEHTVLAADEGTWDAIIKGYMGDPDAEPMVSKGTEVNKVLPGGLWLLSEFKADEFEGRGQFGYDTVKQKYVGSWIDTMSTGLTVLEGTYDAKTKTMTYVGDGVDPATKSKYTQKMVTTTKPDGSRVFILYMTSDQTGGKETKFMEITYTKRK